MTGPRRPVFSLDGGGVLADVILLRDGGPLGAPRLRAHVTDNPAEDLTVYVEDGRLHVVGQYRPVLPDQAAPNHVALTPGPLPTAPQ